MLDQIGMLAWNQREYRTLLLIKAHIDNAQGRDQREGVVPLADAVSRGQV